jgi:hypothetical protein
MYQPQEGLALRHRRSNQRIYYVRMPIVSSIHWHCDIFVPDALATFRSLILSYSGSFVLNARDSVAASFFSLISVLFTPATPANTRRMVGTLLYPTRSRVSQTLLFD